MWASILYILIQQHLTTKSIPARKPLQLYDDPLHNVSTVISIGRKPSSDICWWSKYEFKQLKVLESKKSNRKDYFKLANLSSTSRKLAKASCVDTPMCNYITWDRYRNVATLYFVTYEYIMGRDYAYATDIHSFPIECQCLGENKKRRRRVRRQQTIFLGWASQLQLTQKKSKEWKSKESVAKFDKFASRFNKTYKSAKEAEHRRRVFQENLCRIDMFNWKSSMVVGEVAEFGITAYSDLTRSEFSTAYTGLKPPARTPDEPLMDNEELDKTFTQVKQDFTWKQCGVLPDIREQGPCGSCYAFGVADLLASQHAIDSRSWSVNSTVASLSAQAVLDCVPEPYAYGCDGGRPYGVLQYLANTTKTLPTEQCYPYEIEQDECQNITCADKPSITELWSNLYNATGPNEMKIIALLTNWGPSIATISVPDWLQFYKKGIMRHTQCGRDPEHAVLLVGYNTSSPIPYYVIKNSWGSDWGEDGYMRLEAGENTCGVANYLVMACTKNCARLNHTVLMTKSNANQCALGKFTKRLRVQKLCFFRLSYEK